MILFIIYLFILLFIYYLFYFILSKLSFAGYFKEVIAKCLKPLIGLVSLRDDYFTLNASNYGR